MKKAINVAIIKNSKILVVKKNEGWVLPGGKPEVGESELECLCREVREELSGTELKDIRYYEEFKDIHPYKGHMLKARVYFADIKGRLNQPSNEINAAKFINDVKRYKVSDITLKIIEALKRDGYL